MTKKELADKVRAAAQKIASNNDKLETPTAAAFKYSPLLEKFPKLQETLITLMAGRASEELYVGEITTGAHNDFERATHIARSMITKYGMTELGKYQYESDDPNHVYRVKQYSNESAEAIDKKINEILDIAYNKAKEILTRRSEDVHLLAKTIQEVETLGKDEIDYLNSVLNKI